MTNLVLLDLANSRRPQILTFVHYHQARKHRQNIYRASYQAGYFWRQSVEELDIPDPEQWCWKKYSKWFFQHLWTTYGQLNCIQLWLRISLRLVHVRLESAKAANVHEPMLHAHPFADAEEVVPELYITVVLNFCFCRQTDRLAFFISVYSSLSSWFIVW